VYVVRSVMEGGVEAPRHDLPGSARAGAA
jgi:hypothetical protein